MASSAKSSPPASTGRVGVVLAASALHEAVQLSQHVHQALEFGGVVVGVHEHVPVQQRAPDVSIAQRPSLAQRRAEARAEEFEALAV